MKVAEHPGLGVLRRELDGKTPVEAYHHALQQ